MENDSLKFEDGGHFETVPTNGNACVGTDINSLVLETVAGNGTETQGHTSQFSHSDSDKVLPEDRITPNFIPGNNGNQDVVPEIHSIVNTVPGNFTSTNGNVLEDINRVKNESNQNSVKLPVNMDTLDDTNDEKSDVTGQMPDTSGTAVNDSKDCGATNDISGLKEEVELDTHESGTGPKISDSSESILNDLTTKANVENGNDDISNTDSRGTRSPDCEERNQDEKETPGRSEVAEKLRKERAEILTLKKELQEVREELLKELNSVDDERIVIQESTLLVQNKILQQRRVLMKCLDDLIHSKYQHAVKHSEQQEDEVNRSNTVLEDRKADLENLLGKLPRMADAVQKYNVPDILEAGQKVIRECRDKMTPIKISYLEFLEGEVNFESLASMIGSLKTVGYTKDDQNAISSKLLEGAMPGLHSRTRVREVSVESSCTQISSGDLSDQFTVATQTDFDGDKGCVGPAEGKMVLRVNIDDIENNLDRCCESTPVDLLGLSWRVMANKHWRDQLQIRLYYKNIEYIEKCVEYVEYGYSFKLVNHLNDTWSIVKKESHKIGRDSWWDNVIGWGRLEDPKSGYVLNRWFTIEATVSVIDVKFY